MNHSSIKKHLHRIVIVPVLLLITISSLLAQQTEVIILHTNDMHARIENMGKLAYLADSLRKIHPYVFLVSAGDNFTGNPVVDMVADKGYPMIDVMNRTGFTVSEIGNHEFDMGQELLGKRIRQAKFPFICSNIETKGTKLKQPKPYIVLKAGKSRIAVLGIIELGENGLPDSHPAKLTGLKFTDGVAKATKYIGLKKKYGTLVALTHLGVWSDSVLAMKMPETDLIIGGHSHTLLQQAKVINGVTIVQAGANLQYVGKTTLILDQGHVKSIRDTLIALKSLQGTDEKVQALVTRYNNNPEFDKVAGIAAEPLENKEELGCLMTDAILAEVKTDFAFQNEGGIRLHSIPKGNITLRDIYRNDPFGNSIVVFKLTGSEIESLIVSSFNREKKPDLVVSGLTYTTSLNPDGSCKSAKVLDRNGQPLDGKRMYLCAMNSYMASAYKFPHAGDGEVKSVTTAEALIHYLSTVKEVNYKGVKRVNP
jgi:5'-nucleotidase / UDP-sugar diphosphatase